MFSFWIPLSVKFESFLLGEPLNQLAVSRKPEDTFCAWFFLSFPLSNPTHTSNYAYAINFFNSSSFYSDYIEMCLIGPLSFRESEQMEERKLLTKFSHLIDLSPSQ